MPPSRPPSPTPSALPPIPSSPTFSYASTANPIPSSFNLPLPPAPHPSHAVLTKSDLEASQIAYSALLTSAKEYRQALAALSLSASTFGSALESCARLKEARSDALHSIGGGLGSMSNSFNAKGSCTADSLLAASGVHHLIANHQQILSETVYRSFEVPLLHELDTWRRRMEEEEVSYQKDAKGLSKEIRRLEKEGLRLHRQRKRDVSIFREHLVLLTSKLDGLTTLHGSHSRGLLGDCQDLSKGVVECSAGLVRAEVDIFEALARKGWNGGGLDELLEKGKDLFANESDTISPGESHHFSQSNNNNSGSTGGGKIFSILPQNKSILAVDGNEDRGHKRNDSLMTDGLTYQSLTGAVQRDTDVASIFSESGGGGGTTGILNRSRGVRPFSPAPTERIRVSASKDPLEGRGRTGSSGREEVTILPELENEMGNKNATELEVEIPEEDDEVAATLDGRRHGKDTRDSEDYKNTPARLFMRDSEGGGGGSEYLSARGERSSDSAAVVEGDLESSPLLKESDHHVDTAGRPTKRERRWSVTDDGVVSE